MIFWKFIMNFRKKSRNRPLNPFFHDEIVVWKKCPLHHKGWKIFEEFSIFDVWRSCFVFSKDSLVLLRNPKNLRIRLQSITTLALLQHSIINLFSNINRQTVKLSWHSLCAWCGKLYYNCCFYAAYETKISIPLGLGLLIKE